MKNIKLKALSLVVISSMLSTNLAVFADETSSSTTSTTQSNTTTSSSGATTDDLSNYVGSGAIDSVIKNYESEVKKSGDSSKLQKLYSEKALIKTRKNSDSLKDDIVSQTVIGSKKISLKSNSGSGVSVNTFISSMKKEKSSSYRLMIKSSLTIEELKQTISYFDNAEITLLSTNSDGSNNYQILLPYKGRFGKSLASYIESGVIPETLLPNVEVIKPFAVKLNADSAYLSGESLTADWGISKIGAQDYQKVLSTKTKLKVGIIDTGISSSHQDLSSNVYTNTSEVAGDGIDNDGNGYIDDVHGYNFVAGTNNAEDDHGHGSHVSGIVGAVVNGKGIFGVNSNVSLVPLKVLDSSGYGTSYGIVDALNYAANNGIKVVNMSLGGDGTPSNDLICNAITQVKAKGVITVVAAGNENADVSAKVPAGCSDAITVGAVDSTLTKASFSNYGSEVDVSAPGVNIYSSVLNNSYASRNGTSMATPFVTGLVSSMLEVNPNLDYSTIKQNLISNGVSVNSSVNIGKFISMSNVMTSLGVSPDVTSTGGTSTGTTNVLPTVKLSSTKVSTNNYNLAVGASDTDGTIVSSVLYKDGVVYGSGTSFNVTITKDTTFKVLVTDNMGGQADNSVILTYEAPTTDTGSTNTGTTNVLPIVSLSSTKVSTNNYNLAVLASDSDGTIVSSVLYKDGVVYGSGTSFNVTITKDTTFKVLVTDNMGGQADKSVTLTYEAPTTSTGNIAPTVTSTGIRLSQNYYNVKITASDKDGKIKSILTYLNGKSLTSYTNFSILISTGSTFRTVVTDNSGATAETSFTLNYENYAPTVALTTTKVSVNNYNVVANASDKDGKIVSSLIYVDDVLVGSGLTYTTTITKNTVIKFIVTDNLGATAEAKTTLTYVTPVANKVPVVTLTNGTYTSTVGKLTVGASDSDGKIVKLQVYVNDKLYYNYSTSASSLSMILYYSKGTSMNIKVVATDDKGGVGQNTITVK